MSDCHSELTPVVTVFISAPAYLFVLGLRNGQPVFRKETIIMIIIGSAGKSISLPSPPCATDTLL